MILDTECLIVGFVNSEDFVCNFDVTVLTSFSTNLLERWSPTVQ